MRPIMNVQFAQRAVIIRQRRILLLQKSQGDVNYALRWELPGGRLEDSESLDEQLQREVREEVGLEVSPQEPLALWMWRLASTPQAPPVVAVARYCIEAEPAAQVSFEAHDEGDNIRDYAWVDVAEIEHTELIDNSRAEPAPSDRTRRAGWGRRPCMRGRRTSSPRR
jgi:ADP-ribose pyrophosphatase YjhB (NUDIX family)